MTTSSSQPPGPGSADPRTISDEIRIIRARSGASDTAMLIQAVARALIAIGIVIIGGFLLWTGRDIPAGAQNVGWIILGVYFGSESVFKLLARNGSAQN